MFHKIKIQENFDTEIKFEEKLGENKFLILTFNEKETFLLKLLKEKTIIIFNLCQNFD